MLTKEPTNFEVIGTHKNQSWNIHPDGACLYVLLKCLEDDVVYKAKLYPSAKHYPNWRDKLEVGTILSNLKILPVDKPENDEKLIDPNSTPKIGKSDCKTCEIDFSSEEEVIAYCKLL